MLLFPHDDTRPETLRQVYQAVRTLLDPPSRWTQSAWATTSTGMVCPALAPEAWCYCLTGGLFRVLDINPFSLQVIDDEDRDWVEEHLPEDRLTWGDSVVVEHRYIRDIVEGAVNDGLEVAHV